MENINSKISSLLSYASFGLMILYSLFARKTAKFNVWLVFLGLIYFAVGSLNNQIYLPATVTYLIIIIKYFIIVIAGYNVAKDTSKNEMFFFLLLGALTVFLQLFVFYNRAEDYGRYSGFYLNPNSLGFICIMGYGLTFGLNKSWRTLGQIIFSIVGFLTFSRTFIVIWLFMNLLSIRLSLKNLKVLAIGLGLFVGLLVFNELLPKSNPRLEAMSKIFEGKSNNTSALKTDTREKTWSIFYPALFKSPVLGNGYGSFIGGGVAGNIGVHNSFLRIMGEAGFLTLFLYLIFFGLIVLKSWRMFFSDPHLFLMIVAYLLFLLTNHDYFEYPYLLFFIMWLQYYTLENKRLSHAHVQEKIS